MGLIIRKLHRWLPSLRVCSVVICVAVCFCIAQFDWLAVGSGRNGQKRKIKLQVKHEKWGIKFSGSEANLLQDLQERKVQISEKHSFKRKAKKGILREGRKRVKQLSDKNRVSDSIILLHTKTNSSTEDKLNRNKQKKTKHTKSKLLNKCDGMAIDKVSVDKQAFSLIEDRDIYVFSAFLDTRKEIGRPQIRVIAAGLQEAYNHIPPMYCVAWFEDAEGEIYGVNKGKVEYEVIYRSTLWPKMYTSHFILCDIGSDTDSTPVAVSIVPKPCHKPKHILPAMKLVVPERSHNFTLCVSPLYGNVPHLQLIEFIEIHRLLGVEKITFYRHSVSGKVSSVLEHYKKIGVVQEIKWDFPGHVEQSYFMQRVALNDCLYRNMAHSRYTAIYDLDEMVVPNSDLKTWKNAIYKLQQTEPRAGAFLFQHAYFRANDKVESDLDLITQTSLWRTSEVFPEGKIRCKSIYNSQRALAVDIHFPYSLLEGYEEVIVDPNIAKLHHYRKTPMSNFDKQHKLSFVKDTTMLQFGPRLIKRTKNILRQI